MKRREAAFFRALGDIPESYIYFRLVITETQGADYLQISRVEILGQEE